MATKCKDLVEIAIRLLELVLKPLMNHKCRPGNGAIFFYKVRKRLDVGGLSAETAYIRGNGRFTGIHYTRCGKPGYSNAMQAIWFG